MMGGWNSRMGQEQDEVGGETHQDQSSLFLQSERVDPSSQSNEISVHKFKMPDNPGNDENQHKLLNEKVAADGIPFQEYSNYLEKVDDAKLSKVKGDSKNAIYEDEVKSSENEYSEEDSGVYSNNDDSDENQLLHKSGNHEFLTKTSNVLDEDIKENIAKEKKTDDNSDYANENDSMQKKDNPKNLKNCQPLDIDESKITDDIEKRQRILCKICKNLIEEYSMHNHIRYHGVRSYGDYEYDNEYYNRCRICDHVMTFSYKHIQSHVYNVHGVTLGDYKNTYMRDAYTNMVNKGNQNHKHDNKTAMKRSRKCRKKGSCTEDTRFITDDIRDMRKVKCKLCGKIVLRYFMDGHIHHKHNVTHQEYGSFEYINNVSYYRCKLCPAVITFDFRLIGIHLRSKHDMKLSDYKLQHMGWKGNMTYDEMVSHLNRIQPRKTIQNQKDNIEDEIKAITKRSRKSENNDECPNDSEDEKKTAMKRSRKSENNDECPNDSEDENKTAMKRSRNSENNNECSNRSKDENKTAMKRSRKSENNDECSNDSKDENKTAMKRSRKSENNDECSNDSEDGNKTAMKKSRKSENNDECPNTSKGLEGSCNEDSRFISDDIREMRKIKCKLCGEIVLGYSFDGHLGWKHKVTRQEYGSLDYINNVSYYRCKLCQDVMIFDFKHINYHVGKVHSTKLSDYKLQYMGWKNKMTYEEMVSHLNIINPRKSKIQESAPKVEKDTKNIKIVGSSADVKEFKKPKPQNSPTASGSNQEITTKGTAFEDTKFVTDDIREMRKCKCRICGCLILSSEIRHHMVRKHKVPLKKCGPIKDINNSFYRCKICSSVFGFCLRKIGNHVRHMHRLRSVKVYKKKYMGWDEKTTYDQMVEQLDKVNPRNHQNIITSYQQMKIDTSDNDESDHNEAMEAPEIPVISEKARVESDHDEATETSEMPVISKKARVVKKRIKEVFKTSEPMKKHEVNEIKTDTFKRIFSDDVDNMCLIKCNICDMTMSSCKKLRHFQALHKDSKPYYTFVRKTYYRCPDCAAELLFCYSALSHHATVRHNTSLAKFKAKYLKKKPEKLNVSQMEKHNVEEKIDTNNKIFPDKSNVLESQMKINTSEDAFEIPVISKKAGQKTDINNKIFSDDVNNMCLIQCNICQMTLSSNKKKTHFRTFHKDSKPSYTYVRKTYYRCPDCERNFLFCYSYMNEHARVKHKISLKEFKAKYLQNIEEEYYSDNVSDLCQYRCLSCGEENIKAKESHIRKVHKKNKNKNFELMEKVLHRCKICNTTVIFNQPAIMTHLNKCHSSLKIRFKEYSKKYLNLESQMKIDASEDKESDHDEAFEIPVIPKKARVVKKRIKEVFKTSEPMKKHNVGKKPDTNSKIFSDDVDNMCLIKCNICDMTIVLCKKWSHFRAHHKDSRPSYTYVRKTYYRCPDCAGEFLFCSTALSTHANTRHNISLAEYKARYLKIKMDKSNFTKINYRDQRNKEKRYSNNVSELCKYKCLSCGEENIEVKNIHTKNVHPEIKRKYKVMEKILHRCKICNTTTIFNSEGINKHLKKCHPSLNMTFKRYCKTYLNMEPQDDEMQMNLQVHEEKTNDKMPTKIKHKEKYYSDNVSKEKYYSDNVSELCQYKCLSCGEENIEVKSTHTNNVHPEIKKKYKVMEKILHRCKICNKSVIFNPVGINGHLKKSHPSLNITFKKYSKTYLNQDSKTKVTKKHPPGPVRCTYCPILGTKEQIVSHTKLQHKAVSSQVDVDEDEHMAIEEDHTDAPKEVSELTTEEDDNYVDEDESENPAKEGEGMKIFTNNVNLLCTSKCLRCKNIVLSSKRKCHIKYHHKDLKFSKKLFRSVRKTYHRCKLCNQELLFSMCSIGEHLRIKHNISTVTQYRWEHCVQQKVNQQVDKILTKTNERIKTKNSVDKSNIEKKRKHDEQDSGQSFKYQRNQNNTLRELAGNKDFLSDESDDEEDELVDNCYSTDVHKMCLSRCLYCLKIFSLNNIRPHIYRNHSKSTGNNDEQKFVYVRKTYYRCRICGKSLLFSFDSIFLHVKNNHYMNLAEYKDKYMGYNKDKYVYRRRPVYQSLSITPEIKLESSSPSIKTEPGLVPEPEEQKSLYFLQQNSSVLPKQEPDSEKTATGTDTLIHKQASTETSSALSENNTNLNIETLKTGHEESDSRLENLENLEEQANSLENLKNSEDTVDTSEAHIPEDLENGVKKEEDCKPEFVFKCPFNPCPAFTIEEGLKDGRAANHCIKVHKARPRHLLKLKLNWVRVPAGHTTWRDSVSSF